MSMSYAAQQPAPPTPEQPTADVFRNLIADCYTAANRATEALDRWYGSYPQTGAGDKVRAAPNGQAEHIHEELRSLRDRLDHIAVQCQRIA